MQTAREPLNNIVRIAYQALAAALGGVQTLATSSCDEAMRLPEPEQAARLGLRTQQILAFETGITTTVDPLGGSYVVESLTDALETVDPAYLARIDEHGGAVAAIESGLLEARDRGRGVPLRSRVETWRSSCGFGQLLSIRGDPQASCSTRRRTSTQRGVRRPRGSAGRGGSARAGMRDQTRTTKRSSACADAAVDGVNTIPAILDAVRAHATIGEIIATLAGCGARHRDNAGESAGRETGL